MTVQSPPFVLQNASHSAKLARQAISSLIDPSGGVASPTSLGVTQTTVASMAVVIGGGGPSANPNGEGFVPGSQAADQAAYYFINDSDLTTTIGAADPTNPRYDAVGVWVQDAAYSGSTNSVSAVVVPGTPGAVPAYPTLPNNFLLLAYVRVNAAASSILNSNITDERPLISGRGNQGLVANPAGRIYLGSAQSGTGSPAHLINMLGDFLQGGMTIASNGLVVPSAGEYNVNACLSFTPGNQTLHRAYVYVNGAAARLWGSFPGATGGIIATTGTDIIALNAGDNVALWGNISNGEPYSLGPTVATCYLSLSLASV
jgi:hypothetical protein